MNEKLPNNWIEVNLGDILKLKSGYAFKSTDYKSEGIPVIRISDIQDGNITSNNSVFVEDYHENFTIEKGDILLAMSGATTGKSGIYLDDKVSLQNQRVGNLKPYSENLLEKKIIYYFVVKCKSEIEQLAYGGAQPNISTGLIEGLKFPLPPHNEQKRIVAKLDGIFEIYNQNRPQIEKILQTLKDFRKNVLKSAISGELTKKWRKKNPSCFSSELSKLPANHLGWKIIAAQDACEKISSGSTPINNPFTQTGDIPFLKVYNIQNQQIAFDYKPQFITSEIHKKKLTRSIVKPNDVLMNIVGPPLGKIALVTDQYPEWNINQAIVFFRPKKYLLPKYLYYMLCEGREIENISLELKGSAGQQNISLTQSRNFVFDIPSIEEQELIVSKIDALFDLAKSIEEKYDQVKAKIDKLPESILEKAFRGDLVEQDENDEPAEKLLERIIVEKKKMKK